MARLYNKRPSEVIGVFDTYDAYCFDEACAVIIAKMEDKKEPNFSNSSNVEQKSYSKASDLYKDVYNTGNFDQV